MTTFVEVDKLLVAAPPVTSAEREDRLADIRACRAEYVLAVEKARAVSNPNVDEILRVLEQFDVLARELVAASSEAAQRLVIERAEELEHLRAYILPKEELLAEAKTVLADLVGWGVPEADVKKITDDLITTIQQPDSQADLHVKRAALHKLFVQAAAWSVHVDEYERWAKRTAWFLGALLLIAITGCAIAITHLKTAVYPFLMGGLAGALVSVLGRFPPMLGWGQWASYTPRMIGRITTGLVTTLAGGALLALEIIKIDDISFKRLFEGHLAAPRDALLLVGFGAVFGFSERAFAQLHQVVFREQESKPS